MATIVTSPDDALAASAAGPSEATMANGAPMFTCLSCSIGYPNPEDQRAHYRTDLHRYNMKRRVANLPPVRADVFNAKILERRMQAEQETTTYNQDRCRACNKSFSSANAYQSHLKSKKHKDVDARLTAARSSAQTYTAQDVETSDDPFVIRLSRQAPNASFNLQEVSGALPQSHEVSGALSQSHEVSGALPQSHEDVKMTTDTSNDSGRRAPMSLQVNEDATEEEIKAAIDAKVASSRRIDPTKSCIFCNVTGFPDLDASLAHMTRVHGFFVPEQDYLTDVEGLMKYLSDKVCVGNICLYCNGKGRGFATGEAVRKHMIDKSHCKVAYEFEEDKLELGDFYDFTSSYPDAAGGGWEDVSGEEGDGEDEVMEIGDGEDDDEDDDEAEAATTGVRYGDTEFELVLPSGVRLGHRSMRRYYNQSLRPTGSAYTDSTSGRQLAHRLNEKTKPTDPLMVENRGGHMVRARNRGEAREAKKHISTYRDMAKREHFKTQVGYKANSQKHFRDPLLQ